MYLPDEFKDFPKLKLVSKQHVTINIFENNKGQSIEVGELQFVLKSLHGNRLRSWLNVQVFF